MTFRNVFKVKRSFQREHPETLIIRCSDGRFTVPVADLMAHKGYQSYDTLAIPGGPALLDMSGSSISDTESVRSSTRFLIRGHHTQRVFLIAHVSCGYYQKRMTGQPDNKVLSQQIKDLQCSAAWIRRENPQIQVEAYFIYPQNGDIEFCELEIDPKINPVM
jgi:carbonic anhydrase